ncbi:DUF547 domain-containing protein [Nodosilinea sp. LEGE 07298]|uniref:DUF547 domain-containing protein n=1 Tax=Nodosilinea sp. LEGE 07298 TaxID=2777970 RepID=UPI0018810591|nr:DUF547 domain-containing protein [Nodosilinea sp. LEGE 07298]MBE9110987.1 DUF547 domain-containing protein [Nodosilinea sp. LEGE 07298]
MLDFTPWNTLLQTYVDDQGRVDYARWQQQALPELDAWLTSLPNTLDGLVTEDSLALLINLYNALTIQQVLKHYPIDSILPKVLGLPNWLAFWRFFNRSLYTLDGQAVSLNNVEHDRLRPQFKEPRIHFAVVCASVGCPILRNEAYWPDIVEAQLETDAHRFIHNHDKVRYDTEAGVLYCSKIFKWYGQDFLRSAPSIPEYIGTYLPSNPPLSPLTEVRYLPYDWSLNQQSIP